MDGPPSYLLKTNLDPSWWMSDGRKVREESLKIQRRGKFWKGALQYRRLYRTCRASVLISNRVFIARVWLADVECSHVAEVARGGVSDRKMLYEPHHWSSLHAYPQNAVVGTAKYRNGSLLYVEMSVQSPSTTRVRPRTSIRPAMLA
jgi:hypothetical protein